MKHGSYLFIEIKIEHKRNYNDRLFYKSYKRNKQKISSYINRYL